MVGMRWAVAVGTLTDDPAVVAAPKIAEKPVDQSIFLQRDRVIGRDDLFTGGARFSGLFAEFAEVIDDTAGRIGELIVRVAGLQFARHFVLAVEVVVERVEFEQVLVLAIHQCVMADHRSCRG